MDDLDKDKINVLVDEIYELYIKTPENSLVRFVIPDKKDFAWKLTYIYDLKKYGLWKIHDKEIAFEGLDTFYLLVNKNKLVEFRNYLSESNTAKALPDLYFFDNKVFHFNMAGNKLGSVDFHAKSNRSNDMLYLLSALVNELNIYGARSDGWLIVDADRERMRTYIHSEFRVPREEMTDLWFKSTKNNLKNKIPDQYHTYIDIGNFKKTSKTYFFGLKIYH